MATIAVSTIPWRFAGKSLSRQKEEDEMTSRWSLSGSSGGGQVETDGPPQD
jgi:hypothetical protein